MEIKFMQRAIELAHQNVLQCHGGPFGAVVVKDGKVIGEGYNEVTASLDPTAHAEVMAIRRACQTIQQFHLQGAELYSSCDPCPMCLSAIYWARIDKLYYACEPRDAQQAGFDDVFIYEELAKPIAARKLVMQQGLRAEGLKVFQAWMQSNNKIEY